jgi:hypothetical protein
MDMPRILIHSKHTNVIHVATETFAAWATTVCGLKQVLFQYAFTEGHPNLPSMGADYTYCPDCPWPEQPWRSRGL